MGYSKNELFINRDKNDLDRENDLFGVTDKGDAIVKVLLGARELKGNNMIALYGDWGSGKTSLMKYIMKQVSLSNMDETSQRYKTVFFEAWKYEKDQNLALSLLEQIITEVIQDDKLNNLKDDLKNVGITILKFAQNMLLNTKVNIFGIELELGQAGQDTIAQMNEQNSKVSMYYQYEQFKKEFKKLEQIINKKYSQLVICIDDLDRCEPENVLNLLSVIKLFFIHNENFIYLCGLDKEAVKKSIDVKYKHIIKSNEYLEKIFDITFNMPRVLDFRPIISLYFRNTEVKDETGKEYKYLNNINEFFSAINFTTPRHIKKVFNKFELLRRFKYITDDTNFPAIQEDGNVILIIFTLYLIILHEFHKEKFDELTSYEKVFSIYEAKINKDRSFHITQNFSVLIKNIVDKLAKDKIYISYDTINRVTHKHEVNNLFYLTMYFLPYIEKGYDMSPEIKYDEEKNLGTHNLIEFVSQFSSKDNSLQIGFLKFLISINKNIEKFNPMEKSTSLDSLINYIHLYL